MKTLSFMLLLFSLSLNANTFYIDPSQGNNENGNGSLSNPWKTLEYVVDNNFIESYGHVTPYDPNNPQLLSKNQGAPIKSGDTIMLLSGLHGDIFIKNYINTSQITIQAAQGHTPILKKLRFLAAKNWVVDGLTISSEPYGEYVGGNLVFLESNGWFGPTSDIIVINNHIYSTTSPWNQAQEWLDKVSSGIYIRDGHTITLQDNNLENVNFALTLTGDYIECRGNTVTNFSGDGIRMIGSYQIVERNVIKNCYKINENHDDGIQSWTTNGAIVDYNIVRNNIIINYEDPNQPLLGTLQGIGLFDGPYNNWIIENNLIIVNHWHGISLYAGMNCLITNNTVLDPNTTRPGPSWIRIDKKSNQPNPEGNIIKNNISNSISIIANSNTTESNNIQLALEDYTNHFEDYINYNFKLIPTSSAVDAADDAYAPDTDIEGNTRPFGSHSDIGAYEFTNSTLGNQDITSVNAYQVYPNPTKDIIYIKLETLENTNIQLYNVLGEKLLDKVISKNHTMSLSGLSQGLYFLQFKQNDKVYVKKIVKQ